MEESEYHKSVLLREVLDLLQVKQGKKYIDATLGGGGHAREILKLGGEVLGIDADYEAIRHVKSIMGSSDLTLVQGNFKDIDEIARRAGFEEVQGIIYDLGVSSYQLSDKNRGFSFQSEGPLDMRMDVGIPVTAADLLNLLTKGQLYEIFTEFGEERNSRAIANSIVGARRLREFKTTSDLVRIIESVYKIRGKVSSKLRANLNKRVFQALRIAVNNELENLKESLPKAPSLLDVGGRVAVISFHSLEDRIVKESFRDFEKQNIGKMITQKPLVPTDQEVIENIRARSAKLRVFEKL